jgi:hypothetical protein
MSKVDEFNELTGTEFGVWCDVAPGTDPVQWASLCRWLGHLPPAEFEGVLRRVRRHRLKAGAKRLAKAIMGSHQPAKPASPLISIGPSGLGGQYQRELKARTLRRTGSWSETRTGRGAKVDIRG